MREIKENRSAYNLCTTGEGCLSIVVFAEGSGQLHPQQQIYTCREFRSAVHSPRREVIVYFLSSFLLFSYLEKTKASAAGVHTGSRPCPSSGPNYFPTKDFDQFHRFPCVIVLARIFRQSWRHDNRTSCAMTKPVTGLLTDNHGDEA